MTDWREYMKEFQLLPPDEYACDVVDGSLQEFLAPWHWEPSQHPNLDNGRRAIGIKGEMERSEWLGISGGSQGVYDAVMYGWPDGVRRAKEVLDSIHLPPASSFRRERVFGENGNLSTDRYLAKREDKLYLRHRRRKVKGRSAVGITRLYVEFSGTAGKKAETFFNRGAGALALASVLEEAGRGCEIWGYCISDNVYVGDFRPACHSFLFKEAGQPLNIDKMAAVFGLSGFFRVHGFMRMLSSDERDVTGGFGTSNHTIAPPRIHEHDLIIGGHIGKLEDIIEILNSYVGYISDESVEIRNGGVAL